MSLIEEALRRAQGPITSPDAAAAPKTSSAPPPVQTPVHTPPPAPIGQVPAPAHSWSSAAASRRSTAPAMTAAAVALGFFVMIIAVSAIWLNRQPPAGPTAAQQTAAQAQTDAAPAAPTVPEGPTLSGIVMGGNEPYAVVNEVIVTVGDRLDGYLVTQITEATVTLKDARGRPTLLQLSR